LKNKRFNGSECLDSHWKRYKASKARIDEVATNIEEIYDIKQTLKRKRIPGFKLNYSL
jgi:hypothetical protein